LSAYHSRNRFKAIIKFLRVCWDMILIHKKIPLRCILKYKRKFSNKKVVNEVKHKDVKRPPKSLPEFLHGNLQDALFKIIP
jgi:hypothetical protein